MTTTTSSGRGLRDSYRMTISRGLSMKHNAHVEDYYRHILFNLNSKDVNKFEGY